MDVRSELEQNGRVLNAVTAPIIKAGKASNLLVAVSPCRQDVTSPLDEGEDGVGGEAFGLVDYVQDVDSDTPTTGTAVAEVQVTRR